MGNVTLNEIYNKLQDEESRTIYKSRILYSITRDLNELSPAIDICKQKITERVDIETILNNIKLKNKNALQKNGYYMVQVNMLNFGK